MINLRQLKKIEWPLAMAVIGLNLIGITTIWSVAGVREGGLRAVLGSYPVRQFCYMLFGICVMGGTACFNYLYLQKYAWWIYGGVFVLLLIVLSPVGISHRGSQRWIPLGVVNLQPSELAKIGVSIGLARYLMYKKHMERLPNLIPPFLVAIVPTVLILMEPDLGTAVLFGPIFLVVLFAAGASPKHLGTAVGVTLLLIPFAYQYGLEPYQKARIVGFIQPEKVPMDEGYHLIRSRIAIGSGGVTGKGFGQSVANYSQLVPERHNDFIFTVIGEEGGLLGAAAVVGLFMVMLFYMLKVAYFTREPFGRLLITGLATVFTIQSFVNIGMTIGLAPVTGLTLPFVSYGGSSLATSYLAIGIVHSVKAYSVPSFSEKDHDYSEDTIRKTPMRREGKLKT